MAAFQEVTWTNTVCIAGFLLPVTMPASVATGDLLLVAVMGALGAPAGWTYQQRSATVDGVMRIYSRVSDGTEGGTTVNFDSNSVSIGNNFLAGCVRYRTAQTYASINTKTYSNEEFTGLTFSALAVGNLGANHRLRGGFVAKQGGTAHAHAGQLSTDRGFTSGNVQTTPTRLTLHDFPTLTGDQTAEAPLTTVLFTGSSGDPGSACTYYFTDDVTFDTPSIVYDAEATAILYKKRHVTVHDLPHYLNTGMTREV